MQNVHPSFLFQEKDKRPTIFKIQTSAYNSSTKMTSWKNLPDIVFSDIMMMVGMDKLENIPKYRQVCQSWNEMVSQMTKLKKDTVRRKTESLAARIRRKLAQYCKSDSASDISVAAILAHHELLGSVETVRLKNVDLASVPAEHLASLASCVTERIFISNVSNIDLVSILDSVKCTVLNIDGQSLSSEETWALVRAMESHVEVGMGARGKVILDLDMTALQFHEQGKCKQSCFHVNNDDIVRCAYVRSGDEGLSADRCREEVRLWAQEINRDVKHEMYYLLWIYRVF